MLTELFPKAHSLYTHSSASDWLEDFARWLINSGYSRTPAKNHWKISP